MFITTIGIDYKLKTIQVDGHGEVRMQIWDTAGQERFRTLTASYFQGAHGILMVYDISDRKSFASVSTWMDMIDKQADTGVAKILVGNKSDLSEEQIQVKREEGQAMSDKYNIPFHLTSAKTNDGVDEAFLSIAQLVLSNPPKPRSPASDTVSLGKQTRRRRGRGCC
jgi:Ras-related protein Rab-8A